MACLDLDRLNDAPLVHEPFPFVVVPHFVREGAFKSLAQAFPDVPGPGSFPLHTLKIQAAFEPLPAELAGDAFREAIERKFDINLAGRPHLTTIRGHARAKDGAIHTDSETKLITVLLYMNERWEEEGGRLRLLRSRNLQDALVEVPPVDGMLVAFRRTETSWHGHKPCAGPRRVIQFNWLTDMETAAHQSRRHALSAAFKRSARVLRLRGS